MNWCLLFNLLIFFSCYHAASAEQYQDIVVNGTVISQGARECAGRYEALKPHLDKYTRPFTVLDIGAAQGYFSLRIAHDYPHATVVMIEGGYATKGSSTPDELLELCKKNDQLSNLIFLKRQMSPRDFERLADCEHFDVILAFNIIHHFSGSWRRVADALFNLGDWLVVETPPSNDKVFAHNAHVYLLEQYLKHKNGTIIAQTPRHTDPSALAPMILFHTPKKNIAYKHWFYGTSADASSCSYTIESDFGQKLFIKKERDELSERPWFAGINFVTFKTLNGAWPSINSLIGNLTSLSKSAHRDLLPWNIIVQGEKIATIDNSGQLNAHPITCLLQTIRFATLETSRQVERYILDHLYPLEWASSTHPSYTTVKGQPTAPISFGELVDKITILEIKKSKATDQAKLANISTELSLLTKTLNTSVPPSETFDLLRAQLATTNKKLWDIEDGLRLKELHQQFDAEFIELARAVYHTNDERVAAKRAIDKLLGSSIIEEKIYQPYTR